ncbi:hypothetical protein FCV25MIE_29675 [Fagus crenata]
MGGSRSASSRSPSALAATTSTFTSTTRSENPSLLGLVFKIENSQSHGHVQELLAAKLRTYFSVDCVSVVSPC